LAVVGVLINKGSENRAVEPVWDNLPTQTDPAHTLDRFSQRAAALSVLRARRNPMILPLAGGSDGAVFNPQRSRPFSTHGNGTLTVVKENSRTSFEVEQNLDTMNGPRTITFDSKTNHIFA
jgi:hypothetical protein